MKIVSSKELGFNCSPHRFCGGRCPRVMACNYPEKATCKAVQAEIDYLNSHHIKIEEQNAKKMKALLNSIKEKIAFLEQANGKNAS